MGSITTAAADAEREAETPFGLDKLTKAKQIDMILDTAQTAIRLARQFLLMRNMLGQPIGPGDHESQALDRLQHLLRRENLAGPEYVELEKDFKQLQQRYDDLYKAYDDFVYDLRKTVINEVQCVKEHRDGLSKDNERRHDNSFDD